MDYHNHHDSHHRRKKRAEIESSVEARTIYEEDDCLHCGICSFSSKSKKNMLRHSNIVHGVVINDRVRATSPSLPSMYHSLLPPPMCRTTKEEPP